LRASESVFESHLYKDNKLYPSHVYKDNKLFVYENKSDNWQRYLYTIEDIFMNTNIDFCSEDNR